MANYSTWSL